MTWYCHLGWLRKHKHSTTGLLSGGCPCSVEVNVTSATSKVHLHYQAIWPKSKWFVSTLIKDNPSWFEVPKIISVWWTCRDGSVWVSGAGDHFFLATEVFSSVSHQYIQSCFAWKELKTSNSNCNLESRHDSLHCAVFSYNSSCLCTLLPAKVPVTLWSTAIGKWSMKNPERSN